MQTLNKNDFEIETKIPRDQGILSAVKSNSSNIFSLIFIREKVQENNVNIVSNCEEDYVEILSWNKYFLFFYMLFLLFIELKRVQETPSMSYELT